MNSELRSAMSRGRSWHPLALLALAACQVKAAPPADRSAPQPSAADSSRAAQSVSAVAPSHPPKAAQQPAAAPATADAYIELVDLLLKRDVFTLSKQAANTRFARLIPLKEINEMVLRGDTPRAQLELAFVENGTAGNWLVTTAELDLFENSESDALALRGTIEKHLRAKLGKIRKRLHQDLAVPSLIWLNGKDIMVVLSADPADERPPGQWQVTMQLTTPQGD